MVDEDEGAGPVEQDGAEQGDFEGFAVDVLVEIEQPDLEPRRDLAREAAGREQLAAMAARITAISAEIEKRAN